MQRIIIEETGGPEVLKLDRGATPDPGPGEIRIRNKAIGVNFIDTYHRKGLYRVPALPVGIGLEGAGRVDAVGDGVTGWKEGDRAAYALGPLGAYAKAHCVPADKAVKVPNGVNLAVAAAILLKGLTAHYLIRKTYPVEAGETVLFHAAAGGVGLIAVQWLKALGATVIGTAGSEEKAQLARDHGCEEVILYREQDVAERVMEITDGKGVPVVFDGVGKATFETSLDCLERRGLMVSYGNASGPVTDVDLAILSRKGSLYATRPTLFDYAATREDLEEGAQALFALIADGTIKPHISKRFPLGDAAAAHRALEQRETTGSILLIP